MSSKRCRPSGGGFFYVNRFYKPFRTLWYNIIRKDGKKKILQLHSKHYKRNLHRAERVVYNKNTNIFPKETNE